jgi:hypothetical protein
MAAAAIRAQVRAQAKIYAGAGGKAGREKVLASLPLVPWLASEARALPWWDLTRLLRLLPPFSRPNAVAFSFLGSILLHLLGAHVIERFGGGQEAEQEQPFVFASQRRLGQRPIGLLGSLPQVQMEWLYVPAVPQDFSVGHLNDGAPSPVSAPTLDPTEPLETNPLPTKHPLLASRLLPELAEQALQESLVTESLELLRLQDLDRAGAHHAAIISDPLDRHQLRGYVHLTYLRVYGAGSYSAPGNALADLARYMRDHTHIQARTMNVKIYQGFFSPQLLKYPIHFLFQGTPLNQPDTEDGFSRGGQLAYDSEKVTKFSKEEIDLLGNYLHNGGFLYVEGGSIFLRDMVNHVRHALKGQGRITEIAVTHPIYHSFYDFDNGFWGEYKKRNVKYSGSDWYYPANYNLSSGPYPYGLWGVELEGEVVALFNDNGLFGHWQSDIQVNGREDLTQGPIKSPGLKAATNIVVSSQAKEIVNFSSLVHRRATLQIFLPYYLYALTRSQSLVIRRQRPPWLDASKSF